MRGPKLLSRWVFRAFLPFALVFCALWFEVCRGHFFAGHDDWQDKELPQIVVYGRYFRNFTLPMWNPYVFCGMNFMGTGEYPIFFPPAWGFFLLPPEYIPRVATALGMLFVAAGLFFAHRFVSHFTAAPLARFAFACVLALCPGALADFITTPLAYGWLPTLLASLCLTHSARQRCFWSLVILQAVVFTLMLINGWSNVHAYALMIGVLYPIVYCGFSKPGLRGVFAAALGAALAVGINAYRMVPFLLHAWENDQFFETSVPGQGLVLRLALLLRLGFPLLFGVPTGTSLPVPKPEKSLLENFDPLEDVVAYTGVGGLLLALFALLRRPSGFQLRCAAAVFLLVLVYVSDIVANLQSLIVGVSSLRATRAFYFAPVFLVPLATQAFERIRQDDKEKMRFTRTTFFLAPVLMFLALAAWLGLVGSQEDAKKSMVLGFSLLFFLTLCIITVVTLRKKAHRVFAAALVLDMLVMGHTLLNHPKPSFSASPLPTPSAAELEVIRSAHMYEHRFRVFGMTEATRYDRGMMFGIRTPAGFENIPPGLVSQILMYPQTRLDRNEAKDFSRPHERNLALTSTRFVVTEQGLREIPDAIPRFGIYREFETETEPGSALRRLFSPDFPIAKRLILDRPVTISQGSASADETIEIIEDDLNTIELQVSLNSQAILLVNDTWDRGWKAWVNGQPTTIMRANHAFKALLLPEGISRVRLEYVPPGFGVGVALTIVSLLALVLLALHFARRLPRPLNGQAI